MIPFGQFSPKDFKSKERAVRVILEKYPATRNSDLALVLKFWQEIDGVTMPEELEKKLLKNATSAETIRRARQKIQENGEFLADPKIAAQRQFYQDEMRRILG